MPFALCAMRFYSYRSDSTGFASAAFIACELIVNIVMIKTTANGTTNSQPLKLIRLANDSSHLLIPKIVGNRERAKATAINIRKSRDNNSSIFETLAPSTLRMPISLVR